MEERKRDHIEMAFASQVTKEHSDNRFSYEPLLGTHQAKLQPFQFLGKTLSVPIWVSSMTGGTQLARTINSNLARACKEFGMGMGLGSCRILLDNDKHFADFDMRHIIGPDLPFYANIGIAQLEHMLADKSYPKLVELVNRLQADGLIIHVNPMQEWLQPEGDLLSRPPIEVIQEFLELTHLKIILKEVGQGMGTESIKQALSLPIEAFEFAAFGGTNFAKVELMRSTAEEQELFAPFARVGHTAEQMLDTVNLLVTSGAQVKCKNLIISGGVQSFLDGYYYTQKSVMPAVYGQASGFLKFAQGPYEPLRQYVQNQIKGLTLAKAFLRVKQQ